MAQIFRRPPAVPQTGERPKTRPVAAPTDNSRIGRLRTNLSDILAELNKVTWPSREETRNLTIVVIGISVALGAFLGGIDLVLSSVYRLISGTS